MYPESLKNLIESFKMLPGIGEKTAERLAFYVIGMDEENTSFFADSIKLAKEKIKKCSICNGITDKDVCDIHMLCIVHLSMQYDGLLRKIKAGLLTGFFACKNIFL